MLNDAELSRLDQVLATTRSVRLRLDLERPVPDEVILDCIDLAEQAPTGGNQSSRRWLVVRDPAAKAAIAELYRKAGGQWMIDADARATAAGRPNAGIMRSAAHLARVLGDVPAIVIPTIWGEHDGSGKPGLFDSVLQAAWSFCLALRARGLGTAWTTVHLNEAEAAAELLGIPPGVSQVALFPVAYTKGVTFKRAARRPAREITYFDSWGFTAAQAPHGPLTLADGPGVTGELDIEAPPAAVWPLVTDIDLPARFSTEFQGAVWVEGCAGPAVGARFLGTNQHPARGEWQTTSFVVECREPEVFAWHVSDPERPGAQWRFELEALHGGRTRLRQHVTLGPGPSGITEAIAALPDKEARIVARRLAEHRANIGRTLAGIKAMAEGPAS
ncbi:MAG: nitroreductase family protein [Acidimicrobiales bacterium]